MKSLITRIITQSGIEPTIGEFPSVYYTKQQVYEIAEKVAKAWAAEKALDEVVAISKGIGGYE